MLSQTSSLLLVLVVLGFSYGDNCYPDISNSSKSYPTYQMGDGRSTGTMAIQGSINRTDVTVGMNFTANGMTVSWIGLLFYPYDDAYDPLNATSCVYIVASAGDSRPVCKVCEFQLTECR